MRPSATVLKRVMRRRRKGRRPAAVVDHIKADGGPEFEALVKHIAELGFGLASFASRSITLDVPEYFVAMVDDLAGRQSITPEKFMNAILNEGLFEAYLELRAQMNDAARVKKQTPPAGNKTQGQ
jgi:hypothetical protein